MRTKVRNVIIEALGDAGSVLFKDEALNGRAFVRRDQARMYLPMAIGDYTDFFCSYMHAKNVRDPFLASGQTRKGESGAKQCDGYSAKL